MAVEKTLSIVKPDAVANNYIGAIVDRFEKAGLKIVAQRMMLLSPAQAAGFYAEHHGKPFYQGLIDFMTSGPVVVQVLEGEGAISRNRELLGATDPSKAEPGTIRADFSKTMPANAAHGSDSPESAAREIAYFFATHEVISR